MGKSKNFSGQPLGGCEPPTGKGIRHPGGDACPGVLKDETITLWFGEGRKREHRSRRIAYRDCGNDRRFGSITNNMEMEAEKIPLIYKKNGKSNGCSNSQNRTSP